MLPKHPKSTGWPSAGTSTIWKTSQEGKYRTGQEGGHDNIEEIVSEAPTSGKRKGEQPPKTAHPGWLDGVPGTAAELCHANREKEMMPTLWTTQDSSSTGHNREGSPELTLSWHNYKLYNRQETLWACHTIATGRKAFQMPRLKHVCSEETQ